MTKAHQTSIGKHFGPEKISIVEAALDIGVSTATIRNWIKTGYLRRVSGNYVTVDSFCRFRRDVAGKEKLNKRANKSLKDSHNHERIVATFLKKIQLTNTDYKMVAHEYEKSLSDSYRNKEGVYYTPESIVDDLLNLPEMDFSDVTFCDPCCGSGNFIVRALSLGFKPENIFGYDVDPVAVEITRKRISQMTGYDSSNIQVADFLDLLSIQECRNYDYIFTNPPWGKKFSKSDRNRFASILNVQTSLDSSSLFFFACLKVLNRNGMLGLLLPEAFFNISSFEEARREALKYELCRVVDYGKPFKGLVTKAQGIVIKKRECSNDKEVICVGDGGSCRRKIESFKENPKNIINLYCTDEEAEVISHIFSIPHITLKKNAQWALGIVTGNNKKFVRNSPKDGYVPVYKGADITKDGLKKTTCFIPGDFSLYQQVAPLRLYHAREKLVYKFISSELCFFCDTQKRYFLNSANILIPNDDFPVKTRVLGELLSSSYMNWLFRKIFNTHKILRGDLEALPIHSQFLDDDIFDEERYLKKLGIKRMNNGTFRIEG